MQRAGELVAPAALRSLNGTAPALPPPQAAGWTKLFVPRRDGCEVLMPAYTETLEAGMLNPLRVVSAKTTEEFESGNDAYKE